MITAAWAVAAYMAGVALGIIAMYAWTRWREESRRADRLITEFDDASNWQRAANLDPEQHPNNFPGRARPGKTQSPTRGESRITMTNHTLPPKPMRDFVQLDGWANMPPDVDPVMEPDKDGDVLHVGRRREPQRSGTTVRIMIDWDADEADVVRIIRKQLAWFEEGDMHGSAARGAWIAGGNVHLDIAD